MTPSSPAPSKRENQSRATAGLLVAGVRWIGRFGVAEGLFQGEAPGDERLALQVVVAQSQEVEGDEGGRCRLGEERRPARRRDGCAGSGHRSRARTIRR